jgi:hypothetical protein
VGQTAKQLREMWRKRYTQVLDQIFEAFASQEIRIGPDAALEEMENFLERLCNQSRQDESKDASSATAVIRFNFAAYRREAHHYAVDRFYRTYFPQKRGAPPLPEYHLDRILALRRKGKTPLAIADKMGLRKDTAKYQVEAAEKRWHEAVDRIKREFPHFVAPDLRQTGGENHPREPQSKGQNKGKHKGK